jgi:hypothetical protein
MTSARRALLVLSSFAILGIAPCSANDPARSSTGRVETAERPRELRTGASEALALGESGEIAGREGLRLRFVRVIEDSRCPTGVTCVWAGRARVELELRSADRAPETFELEVASGAAAEVERSGLRIDAERLDPHPRSDRATEPASYRLTVRLEVR